MYENESSYDCSTGIISAYMFFWRSSLTFNAKDFLLLRPIFREVKVAYVQNSQRIYSKQQSSQKRPRHIWHSNEPGIGSLQRKQVGIGPQ